MKNFVQRYRHFETRHKSFSWGLFLVLVAFAFLYFLPLWAPFLTEDQQPVGWSLITIYLIHFS